MGSTLNFELYPGHDTALPQNARQSAISPQALLVEGYSKGFVVGQAPTTTDDHNDVRMLGYPASL